MNNRSLFKINCFICNKLEHKLIWDDLIRVSNNNFSKKKKKIIQCLNCSVVRLLKISKKLEDSSIARNIYNKNNSIKEFLKFHNPREEKKYNFIRNYLNFNNNSILESNSGSGIILNLVKKKSKYTAGLDSIIYKDVLESKGHEYFSSIDQIKKKKKIFDVIFSFSELEHKYNPISFLNELRSILKLNGTLVIRVPNYNNIYKFIVGRDFLKYDFRESHNFYFSKNNLDIMFDNHWHEPMKKWFQDNFNLPVKTLSTYYNYENYN